MVELQPGLGINYTLSCKQTGRSGTQTVAEAVFAVRSPPGNAQTTTIITEDSSEYYLAAGQIKLASIPTRLYYLVVRDISLQDNGTKYICISKKESTNEVELDYAFENSATLLKVKPFEGKLDEQIFFKGGCVMIWLLEGHNFGVRREIRASEFYFSA